jgi:prepilin-type N-terminal cleavage/methylation domain-containing protein
MRNNSGFSAFEVAVAIAIVAVIAAITMPNYLKWLRGYRLRGATTNLVADLEMAKIRAIRENVFVAVEFSADGYIVFLDNGVGAGGKLGDNQRNGDERLLRNRGLPAGVRFDLGSMNFLDDKTRFNGRGIPPEIVDEETIILTNSINTKQIIINRLGYMNVQ